MIVAAARRLLIGRARARCPGPQRLVEWQVAGECNYHCSYCIQSPRKRRGHPSEAQLEQLLAFMASLKGRWEIKMSGGEPFAFRGFLSRVLPTLIEHTSHRVSVLTNLSAPVAVLRHFAELSRGRLGVVSASLHLEHTDVESFLARALVLREAIEPEARLVVNAVLVPGRMPAIAAAHDAVMAAGLPFFPQMMKVGRGLANYGEDDWVWVRRLVGDAPTPKTANVAPSYRGRLCWAGASYFVVTHGGEVHSCRAAKRQGEGRLGSILDDNDPVRLRSGPVPCTYNRCPCTTPANRGLIEGVHG